jgi:RNA polymerase sigma-70 factor (ECF subfamily)
MSPYCDSQRFLEISRTVSRWLSSYSLGPVEDLIGMTYGSSELLANTFMNSPSPEQPHLSSSDSSEPNATDAKSSQPVSPNKVGTDPGSSNLLEPYRGYLWALAYAHLDRKLQRKLDASDIVQQTLLRAHAGFAGLRDHSPAVIAAWLRQILASELIDALRHFHRDKRDVDREKSIAADLDQSAAGMEHWIAADQTSPSMAASKNEQLLQLANALLQLPVDQREVVILKHLRDRPLQQIADETGRSTASVAGLLRRGLAQLRQILEPSGDQSMCAEPPPDH